MEILDIKLTNEKIVEILSSADYGISYWCREIDYNQEDYKKIKNVETYEEKLAILLTNKEKPNTITFIDHDESVYELTYEKLKQGVIKAYNNYQHLFVDGIIDAEGADIIIQYALFEELVYG